MQLGQAFCLPRGLAPIQKFSQTYEVNGRLEGFSIVMKSEHCDPIVPVSVK